MCEASPASGVRELIPMRSHVCLPGDPVLLLPPPATVVLGGGLHPVPSPDATVVSAALGGAVECAPTANGAPRYALPSPCARRYVYRAGDPVVATVVRVCGSHYLCHTGAAALAVLDALRFDGATRASRPRLSEGDVLHAAVRPQRGGEAELSCAAADAGLAARDWTSADAVFGALRGGAVVRVRMAFARALLAPSSRLLAALGARVPFEVCVGVNGVVWVRGQPSAAEAQAEARRTVAVVACLQEAQWDQTEEETMERVRRYFPDGKQQ